MLVANLLRPGIGLRRIVVLTLVLLAARASADDGPIAHWQLDEGSGSTTVDASGSGHVGTLVGSPVWTPGRVGNALSFNGTAGMVSVNGGGNLANLQTTGLTVAAWIKRAAVGRGRIIDKNNSTGGWFFAVTSAGNLTFWTDVFTGVSSRNSTAILATGTWQHVAATWDGSASGTGIHLYINGVLSDGATVNASGTARGDATSPLTIGNVPGATTYNFKGTLDDVRVFNRVLALTEIQGLADATAPSAPGSVAATSVSNSQIRVSWTASSDNVAVQGYRVERCTGASCTTFAQVGSVTRSPFEDTGLAPATTYRYRVRAADFNVNLSPYSSIASATTAQGSSDTQAPSPPTSLNIIAASSNEIDLAWNASTDNVGVSGYVVERCQGASCVTFAQVGVPAAATFIDPGRTPSTSYTYRVRARDAAGNASGFSNTVTQVTPASSPDCD